LDSVAAWRRVATAHSRSIAAVDTWEHIVADGDLFEALCHEAMREHVLRGHAKENYREALAGAPYDAKTHGKYGGYQGRILFEYKVGSDTRDIFSDLTRTSAEGRGDKLRRAAATHPDAVAYVLVLGKAMPSQTFLEKVHKFIAQEGLRLKFEVELPAIARGWLQEFRVLREHFRPQQEPTLDDFLGALGESANFPQYKKLDGLYVGPKEYDDAYRILQKKRIVLIVGPPHVGKTFTAVHLLWDFYRKGSWRVRWVLSKRFGREPMPGEPARAVKEPEDSLARFVSENIQDNMATYIEDPFEVPWERFKPARLLGNLVEHVELSATNARVIVTSREDMLDSALRKDLALKGVLVELKGRVTVGTESYGKEARLKLLRRYARLNGCVWLREDLPKDALEAAGELATPRAIALYCELSRARSTSRGRRRCFEVASQELVKAYAREIERLDETPLAVLLTAACVRPFQRESAFSAGFSRLVGGDANALWNRGCEAFARFARLSGNGVTFVHPSYEEALALVLRQVTSVRDLFNEMCVNLARHKDPGVRRMAADAFGRNWKYLEGVGRGVLSELLDRDQDTEVRQQAGFAFGWNWEHLDEAERELLAELKRDPDAKVRRQAASALGLRWEYLDGAGRKLLAEFGHDPDADVRFEAAEALDRNWRRLDPAERELLVELARDKDPEVRCAAGVQWGAAFALFGGNWEDLDAAGREHLIELACDREAVLRGVAADALCGNWEDLDAAGRKLLGELVGDKDPKVRRAVADALGRNWKHLDAARRKLLGALGRDDDPQVRRAVADALGRHWEDLDTAERKLLAELARDDDPQVRRAVADALGRNWIHLDVPGRKLLDELVGGDSARPRG